ncbi:MAG: NADH-quinone oxidoreductase subunit I [Armatimonadota bacterium]|nr:NADH-quinone oxidoreductase subunit I [Armatimonadota bacterium]
MGVLTRFKHDLINTFVSFAKGHRVTWRNMWRERVTLQYPHERPWLPPRFRGFPGVHPELCIVCGACAKACPVQVITIEGKRIPGTKHRTLTGFYIEAGRCMFCGLCEEACPVKPVKAIRMSNTFELAAADKSTLVFDIPALLEVWKSKPVDVPEEEYLQTGPRALAERELARAAEAGASTEERPSGRKPVIEGEDPAARKARLIAEAKARAAARKAAAGGESPSPAPADEDAAARKARLIEEARAKAAARKAAQEKKEDAP